MKKITYLAAIGDVNDYRTWGGIPYFLFLEAKKREVFSVGLALDINKFRYKLLRYFWNLYSVARYGEKGGFQYSDFFLSALWRSPSKKMNGGRIVNCFQLYPLSILNDESYEHWFYIDQTLLQLYVDYKVDQIIGKRIRSDSLVREKYGYDKAKKIIVHSNWCLNSLTHDYGIPRSKIAVILPGANLYEDLYQKWIKKRSRLSSSDELRLVFVGKHPERKGLDRLIRAFRIAKENGYQISLRVLGCEKGDVDLSESVYDDDIEWFGMVDKNKEPDRYFSLVGDCDVGCLLSRAEAGGISLREFHALGIAVIHPVVGGSPEHAIPDASIGVGPNMNDYDIANILARLCDNKVLLDQMKDVSWELKDRMLNSYTVKLIAQEFEKADDSLS